MFLGEFTYSIDEKKRLAIPAKFRQALGKKAVITRGLDACLFVYPWREWEKLAAKLNNLPLAQADARGWQVRWKLIWTSSDESWCPTI